MPYIEIKTREKISRGLALTLIEKGTISAIVTTGIITSNEKKIFDDAGIAWAENIPESEFINLKSMEI